MAVKNKVMLITGASQRIGAHLAQSAHADGYDVVLHYRQSVQQTQALKEQLNNIRENSCSVIQADFNVTSDFSELLEQVIAKHHHLDVLINNASEFFPTDLTDLSLEQYDQLFNSNVRGALFLSKACFPYLKKTQGTIINLVDIHADKPLKAYPVYSMAKAANKMMVQALAKEYAPHVRVNGIAPGCIIWPTDDLSNQEKVSILKRVPLDRKGQAKNIFQALQMLLINDYMTGQTIKVDGGRSLHM